MNEAGPSSSAISIMSECFGRIGPFLLLYGIVVTLFWPTSLHASESAPVLFDNLGSLHHPISTASGLAQRYFDQGLRLVYAFNHEEAIRSFEESASQDPEAAMPYWGIALALGPNINAAMEKEDHRRAVEAIKKARARLAHATPTERAYVEALSRRYLAKRRASRASLDKAYADAMRHVWQEHSDDPDAGVLFAEALMNLRPWDLWTRGGKPKSGTEEILATLESVMAAHPDHPGACHYYIHAVEASPDPGRALACAERLPDLMPGAGHLVHMPAHIYARVGKYHESVEHNALAVHVDEGYLANRHLSGDYADGYYSHNLHFLWSSLMMEGRRADALKTMKSLVATITEEEVRENRFKEQYLTTKFFTLIRFGLWDEMLREMPPLKGQRLVEGIWRLGRGLGHAATGRLPGAEGAHHALLQSVKRFRRSKDPEDKLERDLLKIAERLLAGDIAAHRGRYDDAIKAATEAVKIEESLQYSEPPLWPLSPRHYLGPILLLAGRPGEAEQVYRDDLTRHPENGWALFGLAQSLQAQHKDSEADEALERFRKAWGHADVTLAASRF